MAVAIPLVFGMAGSAIGATFGFAALGYTIGATIGSMLFAPKQQDQHFYGARLQDLRATQVEYGSPIHVRLGQTRGAGTIVWQSDFREVATTTTQESGGKGGGGASSSYTNYTYFVDLMILLNDIPTDALARVLLNSELVYNVKSDADDETVYNSIRSNQYWSEIRFYSGAPDQLPDPDYEAAKGVGNVPAHRGATAVFIKNLALGASDQLPSLEFELFENADTLVTTPKSTISNTTSIETSHYGETSVYVPENRTIWYHSSTGIRVISDIDLVDYGVINDPSGVSINATGGFDMALFGDEVWIFRHQSAIVGIQRYNAKTRTYIGFIEIDGFTTWYGTPAYCYATKNRFYVAYTSSLISGPLKIAKINTIGQTEWLHTFSGGVGIGVLEAFICTDTFALATGQYAGESTYQLLFLDSLSPSIISEAQYAGSNAANGYPANNASLSYDSQRDLFVWVSDYDYKIRTMSQFGVMVVSAAIPSGTYSRNLENCAYDALNDVYLVGASQPTVKDAALYEINPNDLTIIDTHGYDGTGFYSLTGMLYPTKFGYYAISFDWILGALCRYYYRQVKVSSIPKTLQETVAQLCDISGLSASDIDVTELSAITTPVEGLTITSATSMRQPIEALMGSYYFTACQSGDKIKFTPRGGSSLATFAYDDLGASFGDSTESALSFNMGSDTELPSRMSVTYQVLEGDYQKDTQMSDRIVTAETNTVSDVMLPIIMSAEQAKGVAITNALDAQVSLMSAKIKVLFNHPELEPGDVVTVTDRDGSQYRMRITQITDSFPIREFDLVLDDASILTYSGITNADFFSQSVVLPLVDSDGLYLDIPILSDINNDAGFYVVSGPVAEGKWYGAVTLQSDNDLDYVSGVVVPERGYFGSCTTTLGDWTGYHVFDEMNSITFTLPVDAVLTSSTRAGVLASQTTNAFLIGNEIIQAVDCTELSAGVWKLTRLLRGLRGTEWAMVDHVAGERAVWLRSSGMRRLPMSNSLLGLTRYYKTFSNNRAAADYDGEAFVNMAIGMKPFSPTTARGTRDLSGNLIITCQRRTRLSCRYGGAMGVSIPLGENVEQYEIDVYDDNTYTTVLRTIAATSESAEYTAAQQTTDFGSTQAQVYVKIYQISQVVGRGYALTGVV